MVNASSGRTRKPTRRRAADRDDDFKGIRRRRRGCILSFPWFLLFFFLCWAWTRLALPEHLLPHLRLCCFTAISKKPWMKLQRAFCSCKFFPLAQDGKSLQVQTFFCNYKKNQGLQRLLLLFLLGVIRSQCLRKNAVTTACFVTCKTKIVRANFFCTFIHAFVENAVMLSGQCWQDKEKKCDRANGYVDNVLNR